MAYLLSRIVARKGTSGNKKKTRKQEQTQQITKKKAKDDRLGQTLGHLMLSPSWVVSLWFY